MVALVKSTSVMFAVHLRFGQPASAAVGSSGASVVTLKFLGGPWAYALDLGGVRGLSDGFSTTLGE
jgi:hypothetical protein